jgi:hypothetical protein
LLLKNKIPILEDKRVIIKNKKAPSIPASAFILKNLAAYRKVSSLSPTPPIEIGITLTIDEIKNKIP